MFSMTYEDELRDVPSWRLLDDWRFGAYHDEVRQELLRRLEEHDRSCPCEWLPESECRLSCSCANPIMSGGCDRCTKYGSNEQRLRNALNIIKRLNVFNKLEDLLEDLIDIKADNWKYHGTDIMKDIDSLIENIDYYCAVIRGKQ